MLKKTSGYFIFMQYKFFVDGECRHDEHQPFVTGNGGVVNTIFITGPDMVATSCNSSSMDVDDFSQRTVRKEFDLFLKMQCIDMFVYLSLA